MSADPDSLVKKCKRPRRSKSEVLMLLEDYKNSGLTQVAFAKSREVPLSTLTNWLRRVRTNEMESSSPPDFLEARVVNPSKEGSEALSHDLELMLEDQGDRNPIVKSVRLRGGFDSRDLIRVLGVLAGVGASNQG